MNAISLFALSLCFSAATCPADAWLVQTDAAFEARVFAAEVGEVQVGRPLPTDEDSLAADRLVDARLRVGSSLSLTKRQGWVRSVSLTVEADIYNGAPWASAQQPLLRFDHHAGRADASFAQAAFLRQFKLQLDGRVGRLSVGRMVSTWGLGLLAQSGKADPYQFGVKQQGVLVDRVQLATAPFQRWGPKGPTGTPLYAVFAADRVVLDDLAEMSRGDRAYNLIGALLYRSRQIQAGVYAVSRSQQDSEGSRVDVNVGDVFARWIEQRGSWRLQLASEWLMLRGETTYLRTPTNPDKLNVSQFGGVVRAQADHKRVGLRLEGGLASGDDRPFDDTLSALKLSREYRVGLVMFHEGLRRTSAVTAANLADPRYVGQPPAGFDRAASNGSVSGARYGSLTIRYNPLDSLTLLASGLVAQAPLPLVDAYQSGLRGGAAIGPLGGDAGTGLGWEVDVAADWRVAVGDHLAVSLRGDWGRWQPGDAFEDQNAQRAKAVSMWMGRVTLSGRW